MTEGVPNFRVITPFLARCGQPTLPGWDWLYCQGYNVSIKLNMEYEDSDRYAEALGFKVYSFGMNLWEQLVSGPSEQKMYEIVDHARNLPGKKIIHCEKGEDRTGLGGMFIRIADGWSWQDAFTEAIQLGLHRSMFGLIRYAKKHQPKCS